MGRLLRPCIPGTMIFGVVFQIMLRLSTGGGGLLNNRSIENRRACPRLFVPFSIPFHNTSTRSAINCSISLSATPGCKKTLIQIKVKDISWMRTIVISKTSKVCGLTVPKRRWNNIACNMAWSASWAVRRSSAYLIVCEDGNRVLAGRRTISIVMIGWVSFIVVIEKYYQFYNPIKINYLYVASAPCGPVPQLWCHCGHFIRGVGDARLLLGSPRGCLV